MFNFFKRKNKIKELECRLAVIETQITNLNAQSETNGDLILQIDGAVVGKVALNQLNKIQRQAGSITLNV